MRGPLKKVKGFTRHHFPTRGSGAGFTIIEMIVYIVILTIVAIVVVTTMLSLSGTYVHFKVTRNISTASLTSLDRIVREIREAEQIDDASSVFDTHPGILTILSGDDGTTVVTFDLDGSTLRISEDSVEIGPLTRSEVEVTNLVFRKLEGDTAVGVRIEITLESSFGTTTRSADFYTTAVLRNAITN